MYMVSMGKATNIPEFLEFTKFDSSRLLLDNEDAALYTQLGTYRGLLRTFVHPMGQLRIMWNRFWSGSWRDLWSVFGPYRLTMPPNGLAFVQGGAMIMRGRNVVWKHLEVTVGDHVDFGEIVRQVQLLKQVQAKKQ